MNELWAQLPSRKTIAETIGKCSGALRDDLPTLRLLIHAWYGFVCELLDEYGEAGDDDFKFEPEQLYKQLAKVKEVVGGLQGVAVTLASKAKFFAFEDMSNQQKMVGDKARAHTDKEKEIYARAQAADLDALAGALEKLHSSLNDRIYQIRASAKGGLF